MATSNATTQRASFRIYLSGTKFIVLGVLILAGGIWVRSIAQVWSIPSFFVASGLFLLALGWRYRSNPVVWIQDDTLKFGVFRETSFHRSKLRGVEFADGGFAFKLRDGKTKTYTPSIAAMDAAAAARTLDQWVRGR